MSVPTTAVLQKPPPALPKTTAKSTKNESSLVKMSHRKFVDLHSAMFKIEQPLPQFDYSTMQSSTSNGNLKSFGMNKLSKSYNQKLLYGVPVYADGVFGSPSSSSGFGLFGSGRKSSTHRLKLNDTTIHSSTKEDFVSHIEKDKKAFVDTSKFLNQFTPRQALNRDIRKGNQYRINNLPMTLRLNNTSYNEFYRKTLKTEPHFEKSEDVQIKSNDSPTSETIASGQIGLNEIFERIAEKQDPEQDPNNNRIAIEIKLLQAEDNLLKEDDGREFRNRIRKKKEELIKEKKSAMKFNIEVARQLKAQEKLNQKLLYQNKSNRNIPAENAPNPIQGNESSGQAAPVEVVEEKKIRSAMGLVKQLTRTFEVKRASENKDQIHRGGVHSSYWMNCIDGMLKSIRIYRSDVVVGYYRKILEEKQPKDHQTEHETSSESEEEEREEYIGVPYEVKRGMKAMLKMIGRLEGDMKKDEKRIEGGIHIRKDSADHEIEERGGEFNKDWYMRVYAPNYFHLSKQRLSAAAKQGYDVKDFDDFNVEF